MKLHVHLLHNNLKSANWAVYHTVYFLGECWGNMSDWGDTQCSLSGPPAPHSPSRHLRFCIQYDPNRSRIPNCCTQPAWLRPEDEALISMEGETPGETGIQFAAPNSPIPNNAHSMSAFFLMEKYYSPFSSSMVLHAGKWHMCVVFLLRPSVHPHQSTGTPSPRQNCQWAKPLQILCGSFYDHRRSSTLGFFLPFENLAQTQILFFKPSRASFRRTALMSDLLCD